MNRFSYASLALIAAIPGVFLAYMLVMSMLSNFRNMSGMFKFLVCAILAGSVLMAVMPIGILIFVRDEKEETEEAEGVEDVGDVEDVEEQHAAPVDRVEITETASVETPAGKLEQSKSVVLESGAAAEQSDSVEFDMDVYVTDDEVEETPKKGKKK